MFRDETGRAGVPPDPPRPSGLLSRLRCAPRGAHRAKDGDPTAPSFAVSGASSWSPRRSSRSRRSRRAASAPARGRWTSWPSPASFVAFQNRSCRSRVLLEVLGLEVVGPQHPQVLLDQVRPLLLDRDGARAELRVVGALVLLLACLDRLGLDARLRRVVHAARQVAVRMNRATRCEDAMHHG